MELRKKSKLVMEDNWCQYSGLPSIKAYQAENMDPINNIINETDLDRVIEMAWEDRTSFEVIELQFGLTESDVIKLMRANLKRSSFNLWRKRVNSGVTSKHELKRNEDIKRFKSDRQKSISNNKISKR